MKWLSGSHIHCQFKMANGNRKWAEGRRIIVGFKTLVQIWNNLALWKAGRVWKTWKLKVAMCAHLSLCTRHTPVSYCDTACNITLPLWPQLSMFPTVHLCCRLQLCVLYMPLLWDQWWCYVFVLLSSVPLSGSTSNVLGSLQSLKENGRNVCFMYVCTTVYSKLNYSYGTYNYICSAASASP